MKKIAMGLFLGGMMGGLASNVMAQNLTSRQGETMLPEEGDYALGFDADPFLNYVGNFLNQGSGTSTSEPFSSSQSSIVSKMFKDAQTAYRGRVQLGFGNSGNIYGDPFAVESSVYGYVGVEVPVEVNDNLTFHLDLQDIFFDDAPWSRPGGSDDLIHSYQLGGRAFYPITPQVNFDTQASVYHGGLSNLALGDISEGIAVFDRTLFRLSTGFNYRLDGNNIGDNGWQFRTDYRGRIYNQSGMNLYDTHQYQVTQGIDYRVNPDLRFTSSLAFQQKDWDSNTDLDSDSVKVSAGFSGRLSDAIGYRVSATYEMRDYDNNAFSDQDVFGVDSMIYGSCEDWFWNFFCNYGIQDRNITNSFQLPLADAMGTRWGGSVNRQICDRLTASLWFQGLYLDSEVNPGADLESHYYYIGLGLEHHLSACCSVGAAVGLQRIEYDNAGNEQSETSENFNVFCKFAF